MTPGILPWARELLRLAWWSSCALLLALLCGGREGLASLRARLRGLRG